MKTSLPAPIAYMDQKIIDAPIIYEPFPHIFIQGIFPDSYYQTILDNLPDYEDCEWMEDRAQGGTRQTRHGRFFSESQRRAFDCRKHVHPFWNDLAQQFKFSNLFTTVTSKFGKEIMEHRSVEREIRSFIEMRILRDEPRFAIAPHRDGINKLWVLLFYLAFPGSDPKKGTTLYVPKEHIILQNVTGTLMAYDDFYAYETKPYLPNCVLGFPNIPGTVHGVERIIREGPRDTFIVNALVGKEGTDDGDGSNSEGNREPRGDS